MERGLHLKNEGTFHPFFFSPILLHVLNSTTIFDFTRRKKKKLRLTRACAKRATQSGLKMYRNYLKAEFGREKEMI